MDRELRLEAALEADVKAAVAQEAMVPWFQPVVETATGVIFGVEMLARWPREGGEIVGPGEFMPVVERLGLMNELTLSLHGAGRSGPPVTGRGTSTSGSISPRPSSRRERSRRVS